MRALLQASTFIVALSLGSWLALAECSFALAGEINGRVIGPDGKGIAQAVVFVQTLPDGVSPLAPLAAAQMDQVNEQFAPTLLPIPVGTEVSFPNQDQIHHHVYSFSRTKRFEIPLYRGEEVPPIVFDTVGVVKVGCNIHDWMAGIILVVPTPFYAVTADDGSFTLRDLPVATYPQEPCRPFRNQPLKDLPSGEEFFLERRLDLTAYEELREPQGREQNGQNQAGKG